MENCAVVGSPGNGIVVRGGAEARLDRCLAAAVWNVGAAVQAGGSLLLFNSDIRNCYYTGITAGSGALLNVQRCRISGSAWHGIRYDSVKSPLILSNAIFSNARSGIYASGKTRATVSGEMSSPGTR